MDQVKVCVHHPQYPHAAELIQTFDASRTQHTTALDNILDSLESQLVPPDFHEASESSSLFGSQHSDDDERRHSQSPSDTVRDLRRPPRASDRRRWKNLRDFVDDRAIDQVLEAMDEERAALDVGEVWHAHWGGRC